MKIKVIWAVLHSSGRGYAQSEFYVLQEAQDAAAQYVEMSSDFRAYLWDGSSWTTYAPIP